MSHFLRATECERSRYSRQHAYVMVRCDRGTGALVIDDPAIGVVKDGVAFVELPARFEVLAPDGTVIPRQRGLIRVVSLSTIDPMHMLADVSEDRWASWR